MMSLRRFEKELLSGSVSHFLFSTGLFLISFLLPIFGKGQFREIYRGADGYNDIHGMYFISPSTGFLACTKFVGFTQDSGRTFVKRTIGLNNVNFNGYTVGLTLGFVPEGVLAFSADSVLVYGNFSFEPSILFSDNGGQSWKLVYHQPFNPSAGTNPGFIDLKIAGDGVTGIAVQHEGIIRTSDRGQHWSAVLNAPGQKLEKSSWPAGSVCYVSGGPNMYKSTDGGLHWADISFHPNSGNEDFKNVFFTSTNTGYCSEAGTSTVYRTTDGALHWVKMNNEKLRPVVANDLVFTNDSTGYAATNLYEVDKTTDYGKTWETCKRNTDYQNLSYNIESLFFLNAQTGWAGGAGEYLMMTTNGGGATWPRAYFLIDTSGISDDNTVKLVNYSKPGYHIAWYKNGVFLNSSYNSSYVRDINKLTDTIELIVNNGTDTDTSIQYISFNPPIVITSFSPAYGTKGTRITINGIDLFNINFVSFGNVPASIYSWSNNQIVAIVGDGATGDVKVASPDGSTGKLPGFTYVNEPIVDMPFSVPDTLLCRSEKVGIRIEQTESDVLYELIDSIDQSCGGAMGNGGELSFYSNPVSVSGTYFIRASRHTFAKTFTKFVKILVEHPTAVVGVGTLNVTPGEPVNFYAYSGEAKHFRWHFDPDASQTASIAQNPEGISYTSPGQKMYTIISSTASGCSDTLSGNAAYVYPKPLSASACYAEAINDPDTYTLGGAFKSMSMGLHGDYLIAASGNAPLVTSRFGVSRQMPDYNTAYIAKYNRDGALQWIDYTNSGSVNASAVDASGNIYITGGCTSSFYFHLNTGDSILFNVTDIEKKDIWSKYNGFILKLDSNGKYLWHTVLYDATPVYAGYPVQGGIGSSISIRGNRVLVMGSFLSNLNYVRNGQITPLFSLKNVTDPNANPDDFVLSIKDDGTLDWSAFLRFGQTGGLYGLGNSGFDKNGNVYVAGYYTALMLIHDAANAETLLRKTPTSSDYGFHGFLIKFDAQGKLLWNVHTECVNSEAKIQDLTVDPDGNCYITGGSALTDSSEKLVFTNADGSRVDINVGGFFISRFNTDGIETWTQGSRYSFYGQGSAICFLGNELCIAGILANNAADSLYSVSSEAGNLNRFSISKNEMFFARYDTAGRLKQIKRSGPNVGGSVSPMTLHTDPNNHFIVAGTVGNYDGGNQIKDIFGITINHPTFTDVFFARFDTSFCSPVIVPSAEAGVGGNICPGDSVVLRGYVSNGDASWSSRPEGFLSDSLHPTVAPVRTTTYFLSAVSESGNVSSDSVTVEVNKPPASAGKDQVACNGASVTIGMSDSGDVYNWSSYPAGLVSFVSNPTVTVSVNTACYLQVSNVAGCIARDTVMIAVGQILAQSGNDTSICSGSPVQLGGLVQGDSYSWSSSPGPFSSLLRNPSDTPAMNTSYFLKVMDSLGCIAMDTVLVAVRPTPSKPSISAGASGQLISSATSGNQWYQEPWQAIPGAESPTYQPVADGWYTVRVDVDGCSSAFADSFYFKKTVVSPPISTDSSQYIRIGPNPTHHSITVTFNLTNVSRLGYVVSDLSGRILKNGILESSGVIDFANLSNGVYLIHFADENKKPIQTLSFIRY